MALLQIALGLLVTWAVWAVIRKSQHRSPLDNVPGPTAASWFVGDLERFYGRHGWPFQKELLSSYGPVVKFSAFFGSPMLYVYDPKALHHIVVKDQYIYEETSIFIEWVFRSVVPLTVFLTDGCLLNSFNSLAFGDSLLSSLGERHRRQRKILNPVFNTNHMRYMVPTFYRITNQLRKALSNEVKDGQHEIDMLSWMTRAALELVGQGGLGYSFDPLDRDWKNPFAEDLKALVPTMSPYFFWMRFLPLVSWIGTAAFQRRVLEMLPLPSLQRTIQIIDTMENKSKEILAQKRALLSQGDMALEQQVGEGKDIMSVLLRENMQASGDEKMSDTELLGHMTALIFAAMDTTSGALAHILQVLSEHPDAQEKLRQEIKTARGDQEYIEYDELMNLPYLEAVCRETLRLYSPTTVMTRVTTKDVLMPLSTPLRGRDGTMMNELVVPEGTGIVIGILAYNIDPAIWGPDAHLWKPERWLEPLPGTVTNAHAPGIYSNLMTFLGGGRACIGFKFAQLEMKAVLSVLLEHFKFSPSDKEVYWNWAGIQFPTIGKESTETKMPLRVELVH
ncbi:hypothetical protein EUX98_g1523 [Antrodiella citrinella]|uniref:Cytochrome P450 n=1 Tax=Antrodiella citrinella TaxID=2447956 RepID=A0A4S4N198_9APHY|nr:hypothetical protein EUX98_g1523 [Antrodiella citrinella]